MSGSTAGPSIDVVIVAAGSSRRMDGLDKLEAPIAGRPLLAWTVDAFAAVSEVERIVVVTSADRVARYRTAAWLADAVTAVVAGGARRQESVAAGVRWLLATPAGGPNDVGAAAPEMPAAAAEAAPATAPEIAAERPSARIVLIHDGARPVVSADLIRRIAAAAAAFGAAIPVLPVAETIKEVDRDRIVTTVDRRRLAAAQTPQGVRIDLLERAYAQFPADGTAEWTDEAALLEACTITVHAIPGDPSNLKVTVPADLVRAELALTGGFSEPAARDVRVGFGSDLHGFGPGRPLALGGIEIAAAPRLHGHSDGDVALHAVADALLGAAGLGDLGRQFPSDSSTPDGIASTTLLVAVVDRLADNGLRAEHVDLTIVGARPRFGARLDEMRTAIAGLLRLDVTSVSVKASTGNLSGAEGAGRAISAHAIASVGTGARSDRTESPR